MNPSELGDAYWQDILELNPLLATEVGEEAFDDRLPDLSPEGIRRQRQIHSRALEEAKRLRHSADDVWDSAILDTVEAIAAPEVAAIDLGMYHLAPIDHLWGPGTLLDQISVLQRADSDERIARYLRRLEAMPQFLDQSERLLNGEDTITGPALIVDRCIRQVQDILRTAPEESLALKPIPSTKQVARNQAAVVIRSKVQPAYSRYLQALERYRHRSRPTLGLSAITGGDDMYRVAVRRWTSLQLDPNEIHRLGQEELERIQAERLTLASALGSSDPARAVASYAEKPGNRFKSREEILQLAEDQVRRGWERAQQYFGRLPRANCQVRAIDPSRENDVPEHYFAATRDGSRPAVYYVNTARPDERRRHSLASTTFHEANPGHHLQIALEQEQEDRPTLLRYGGELAGSAFIEGWALYAERLADEMGLFLDGYERLGMLEQQAVRAARLVVDTGLHAHGWPRERAVQVMRSTGLEPSHCELETDRYVAMPGQALAYKIGQLEIEAARRRMQHRQGAAFSLRDFHDRVLSLGSVPLETFRRKLA